MEREVRVERSPIHCPYCKGALEELSKLVACAACGARHHDACHAEHGRCASCGAVEALAPRAPARLRALEPPRGSRVTVVRERGGSTLSFPRPSTLGLALAPGKTGAWKHGLALLTVAAVLACMGLVASSSSLLLASFASFVLGLAGSLVGLIFGLTMQRVPNPPGAIVLGAELEFPTLRGTRKAARADVGHVRTERVVVIEGQSEYRLTIDIGIDRVRVAVGTGGDGLTEPEVDWIADAIRAWQQQA